MELRVVDDPAATAADLFVSIAPRTLALAGGKTPETLYRKLAAVDFSWEGVEVFFGDERCVPQDHPDSNYRMAEEALLAHVPARVHPMSACDPLAYEGELASVFGPGVPDFDLIFLGLGEDGHTASLFPGDLALEVLDRNVSLVERPDHRRMTFTLPVLSGARTAVFLVSGPAKREALLALLAGDDIPAARVAAERVVVVADPAAAGAAEP